MAVTVEEEPAPAGGTDPPSLHVQIEGLKRQAAQMRDRKKLVLKELKNAQRRKKRLQKRCSGLSEKDLFAMMMMRKEGRAAASREAAPGTAAAEAAAAEPPAEEATGAPAL